MNKADRERVEKIKLHCELGPLYHDKKCNCNTCFFLSLIDKHDKVIQVAKEYSLYSIADVDRKLRVALKELEGEK